MKSNQKETRRAFRAEIRLSQDKKKIRGYAALFDSLSEDLGGFLEKIAPGAFANALKTSDVRALINHDSNMVLGRTASGTLRVWEDECGLKIEIDPPNTTTARDLMESMGRGDVDQMSFGFRVAPGGDTWKTDESGQTIRIINEIEELFDVSVVTFPAYPETSAQVRHKKGHSNMNKQEQELRGKWGRVFETAKDIMDNARSLGRGLTPEERAEFSRTMGRFDEIADILGEPGITYRALGSLEAIQERLERPVGGSGYHHEDGQEVQHRTLDGNGAFDFRSNPEGRTPRHAFNRYLLKGQNVLTPGEYRALSMGSDVEGGYLVAPQKFVKALIQAIDDEVHIRSLATLFPLAQAESLGAPYLSDDFDDAEWTTELGTGSEDDLEFGKRELRPHPIAKRVKVSNKLLRAAALNPEDIVRGRLQKKFAATLEQGYMTGNGHNRPLGVFTASADGINTDRDVSDGNDATVIRFDGLINAQGHLKAPYQKRAVWIFHRDAITQIRKLKDGEGNYIWAPATTGAPPTILGIPYVVSEFVPNTFTTGQYVGILGDFSYYWIADALDMQVQRLVELYAETNQTGFIGRMESDGMPVLSEAFVRVKLG